LCWDRRWRYGHPWWSVSSSGAAEARSMRGTYLPTAHVLSIVHITHGAAPFVPLGEDLSHTLLPASTAMRHGMSVCLPACLPGGCARYQIAPFSALRLSTNLHGINGLTSRPAREAAAGPRQDKRGRSLSAQEPRPPSSFSPTSPRAAFVCKFVRWCGD